MQLFTQFMTYENPTEHHFGLKKSSDTIEMHGLCVSLNTNLNESGFTPVNPISALPDAVNVGIHYF